MNCAVLLMLVLCAAACAASPPIQYRLRRSGVLSGSEVKCPAGLVRRPDGLCVHDVQLDTPIKSGLGSSRVGSKDDTICPTDTVQLANGDCVPRVVPLDSPVHSRQKRFFLNFCPPGTVKINLFTCMPIAPNPPMVYYDYA